MCNLKKDDLKKYNSDYLLQAIPMPNKKSR